MPDLTQPTPFWQVAAEALRFEGPGLVVGVERSPTADGFEVRLRGDLDLATAPAVRRRLLELLALPIETVIVDLADLTFLDSSGLSALCVARESARERGIGFVVVNLPEQARRVMELTGTLELFG